MIKGILLTAAIGAILLLVYFFNQPSSSIIKVNPQKNPNQPKSEQNFDYQIIASNLEIPWSLAFLPNKTLIVTERPGRFGKLINGKIQLIHTFSEVKQIGEGGLLGVEVDPNFNQNSFIYFYYTYGQKDNQTLNKVIKAKLQHDKLLDITNIVDGIPGVFNHNGGRLKFGPDGYLYITTGDAQNPSLAQDPNSLAGKILRYKDGKIEVYSLGHRNPQGIAWDSKDNLWETEHGQTATDEVNQIIQGKNYGWPTIRGDQTQPDLISPKLQSGTDTWAPGGLAYFKNFLYFAGLRGQALYQVKLNTFELKTHFKNTFGRIRDVVLGPDNSLYITTSNRDGRGNPQPNDDKIIKISIDKLD